MGRDIVVIGGSAGSTSPLKQFVERLPGQLPAAIFVVVHSKSRSLAKWLRLEAKLPVREAADLQRFQHSNVYICPSGHCLSIEKGIMRVEHIPQESYFQPSINALFRSAASAYGRRAVGIILSGMMFDGTNGMWHIKKHGGVAIVQDPAEAKYPEMPQSAIDNVAIDYILPVDRIADKLVELTQEEPADSIASAEPARVLIVEDERIVAEDLKESLKEFGYQVSGTVSSGESAVRLAGEKQPNVVLMDIRLAGHITGTEAARQIWEKFQIPIIYVTAFADQDTLEQVKTTENYGYIVKPFHSKAVHAAIQLALDRREKEMRNP